MAFRGLVGVGFASLSESFAPLSFEIMVLKVCILGILSLSSDVFRNAHDRGRLAGATCSSSDFWCSQLLQLWLHSAVSSQRSGFGDAERKAETCFGTGLDMMVVI